MAIISREDFNELTNAIYDSLNEKLSKFLEISTIPGSTYDCLSFIEIISRECEKFIRNLIVKLIETADLEFRNSIGRSKRYYVKQTRPRTIVCMFGAITFIRTEYTDRLDDSSYVYIDSKLHLESRQRYWHDVRARVISTYADSKSMIEVGRNIGDIIESKYHNGNPNDFMIPRQTIQKILKETKEIRILSSEKSEIDILNILMDEKWIPGQHNEDENRENKSLMSKSSLIFEDYLKADKSPTKRPMYDNTTYYSSYNKDFSSELLELLDSKYDLSKVKQINIMSDGASWINTVAEDLKLPGVTVYKGLCPYHTGKSLDKITRDDNIYDKAYEYLLNKDLKNFDELIKAIKKENPNKETTIDESAKYLKNHVDEIITIKKIIKLPCAMEQVISHHLASEFTCVAKAYSPKNINYYLSIRDAFRNNYNLKLIYAKANDLKKEDEDVIKINKNELDLSFFDNQSPLPYYQFKINDNSQKFKLFNH